MAETSTVVRTPAPPRRTLGRTLLYIGIVVGALVMLYPFLSTLVTSVTADGNLAGGPTLVVENPAIDATGLDRVRREPPLPESERQ
jgi:ABC-type glycerol-3-phosphate transport system permease component